MDPNGNYDYTEIPGNELWFTYNSYSSNPADEIVYSSYRGDDEYRHYINYDPFSNVQIYSDLAQGLIVNFDNEPQLSEAFTI